MSRIEGYVVLGPDGKLKNRKGRFSRKFDTTTFYLKRSSAQGVASADGDTVVSVHIDLTVEPVFIRHKKVKPA